MARGAICFFSLQDLPAREEMAAYWAYVFAAHLAFLVACSVYLVCLTRASILISLEP